MVLLWSIVVSTGSSSRFSIISTSPSLSENPIYQVLKHVTLSVKLSENPIYQVLKHVTLSVKLLYHGLVSTLIPTFSMQYLPSDHSIIDWFPLSSPLLACSTSLQITPSLTGSHSQHPHFKHAVPPLRSLHH